MLVKMATKLSAKFIQNPAMVIEMWPYWVTIAAVAAVGDYMKKK